MSTTKRRINISLSPDLDMMLSRVAKRDRIPEATKASHLLEIALSLEEDFVFDKIASDRDVKGARFVSHKQAWV
ncbi:MAG: hypothetical protein Q7K54_00975 [Candidatus Parcubacteria bacterium]|nr:hypothetical protein [Candidatus Parcubacteria bacterium]